MRPIQSRRRKWLVLAAGSILFSTWFLRCDRAALNLQRGFWDQLGQNIADQVS